MSANKIEIKNVFKLRTNLQPCETALDVHIRFLCMAKHNINLCMSSSTQIKSTSLFKSKPMA